MSVETGRTWTLPSASNASARTHLLDVAERLLAAQGLPALTIRGLTHEAGVNLATVNYVFGTKDSLLIGLQSRMVEPMMAERRARFATLAVAPAVELADVVLALVEPLATMRAEHGVAAAELYRYVAAHPDSAVRTATAEMLEPDLETFVALVLRALPDQPPTEVEARARLVCQLVVPTTLRALDLTDSTAETDLGSLVAFVVGGLRGP